jgi:bacterioferritin
MQGDQQVIEFLNRALRHELAAVNQYWLHYRILDNWGYKEFAKTWRKESIEEMQHADQLVARILFLDGQPNMQSLDQLRIGKKRQGDSGMRSCIGNARSRAVPGGRAPLRAGQ